MSNDFVQKILNDAKQLGIDTSKPAVLSALHRGDIDEAIEMSQPGGIEAVEAAGAAAMRASNTLPKTGLLEHREALEKIGFVFGDEIDEVLVAVTLPNGWDLVGNDPDDARRMALRDEQGRQRGKIFTKMTHYDYMGCVSWNLRFSEDVIVEDGRKLHELQDYQSAQVVGVVMDGTNELYRTKPQTVTRNDYKVKDKLKKEAHDWLMAKYTDADKPFAHWAD
ncbi:MAG: hypothetical protein AAB783_02455 [Patescibacteria group bacterium]